MLSPKQTNKKQIQRSRVISMPAGKPQLEFQHVSTGAAASGPSPAFKPDIAMWL